MRVAFDDYVFDSALRSLARRGSPIHLSPKAFALLELLVESRPRVLSKSEIVGRIWPDACVADGSLANVALEVRKALGDAVTEPRYLRTVHGFGYAFCAPVLCPQERGASDSRSIVYRLDSPLGEFGLDEGDNLVGRAPECPISLASSTVSRHHARLVLLGGRAAVEDLGSKNGTYVRGQRIASHTPTPLASGERFRVGSVSLVVKILSRQTATDSFPMDAHRD
jgi:DNA-binding winged helix-turn-helix (wHTH) protein